MEKRTIPSGYLTSEDEKFMKSFAVTYLSKGDWMVELGSYKGRSAYCWLEGIIKNGGKIITIDTHRDCDSDDRFTGFDYIKSMNEWGYIGKSNIHIIGNLNDVVKFFNMEIGALFIDALHEYKNIKNDFEKWNKFVKVGGFVIFHDYDTSFKGITDFCNELKNNKDWNFIKKHGQCAFFKRINK